MVLLAIVMDMRKEVMMEIFANHNSSVSNPKFQTPNNI